MTPDARRRFGALTALAFGLFAGLTLLPIPITGPVGTYIGHELWQLLGAGALGIPLLGFGLALAGFERLGALDMKRSAVLIIGLSFLVPYLIGVVARVRPAALDIDVADRTPVALAVGVVPGFFSDLISTKIGVAGAVIVGFLALSALTLVTFAWHPLQRLERRSSSALDKAAPTKSEGRQRRLADLARADAEPPARGATEKEEPPAKPGTAKPEAKSPKSKGEKKPETKAAAGEVKRRVWEVDLLAAPRTRAIDAG